MEKTYTAKQLLTAYMNLKHAHDDLTAVYKEESGKLKDKMEFAKEALQKKMQEDGVDMVKDRGLAKAFYQSVRTMKIDDWEVAIEHVKKNNLFHLLSRNLSKNAVWEIVDEAKTPFPGVTLGTIKDLKIQKA
jgi:hypothetical protein